jgi:autotransporter-associated beta strand protein
MPSGSASLAPRRASTAFASSPGPEALERVTRWLETCLLGALLLGGPVRAATNTWQGNNNDEWGDPTKWSQGSIPDSTDDVIITTNRTIRLSGGIAAVAASVQISGGARLNDRNSGSTLTVGGTISVTPNANVRLDIRFTASGLTKSGTGTLMLTGADTVTGPLSLSAGTIIAQNTLATGSVTMTGGTLNAQTALSSGGTITANGGTLNAQTTLSGGAISVGGGTVTSTGAVTVTGGSVTVSSGSLTAASTLNAASVAVVGGTLTARGNLTATGAVNVSGSGSLVFTGTAALSSASFSLGSGSSLTVNMNTGTTVTGLTVPGAVTLAGFLNVTGTPANQLSQSILFVNSTTGPVDVSGLALGPTTAPGFAFGVHVSGGDVFLDIAQNPIAVDSVATTTGTCAAGTVTWQHTVGPNATDRFLIVGVSTGDNTASALPTSVTYDTQTLTARGGDNAGTTQDEIYTLLAPARGTHTITLTFPAGSSCFVVAGSVSYTGVNQATPIGAVVSNTETGNTPLLAFVTVPVQRGDKVFAVLSSNTATSATRPVGVTARWSALNGTEYGTAETLPHGDDTTAT